MHGEKVFIMATNLSACHPGHGIEVLNRLPGLAEPLLQIDLQRELQQLRREDSSAKLGEIPKRSRNIQIPELFYSPRFSSAWRICQTRPPWVGSRINLHNQDSSGV